MMRPMLLWAAFTQGCHRSGSCEMKPHCLKLNAPPSGAMTARMNVARPNCRRHSTGGGLLWPRESCGKEQLLRYFCSTGSMPTFA